MNASEFGCGAGHQLAITWAKVGGELKDFTTLTQSEEKCRQVLSFLRGRAEIKPIEYLIDCDAPVFIPEKWEVLPEAEQLQNRVCGQVRFDLTKVNLHLVNGQNDGKYIEGNKLRKELAKQSVYTAHVLDYLLKPENQHLIPEEWKCKAVFFWGTIYRSADGNLYVRYLYWNGDRWGWDCYWLGDGWGSPPGCGFRKLSPRHLVTLHFMHFDLCPCPALFRKCGTFLL